MKLNESFVVITGGSLGIGKATAKLLIESGAKVAITGRNRERLEKAAKELSALPIVADVSKSEDVARTFEVLNKEFPRLDVLVNNAGIGSYLPLLSLTEESMRKVWEVNVLGATLMAQAAAKLFVEQNHGDIINIASTAAHKGYASGSAYSSSKFALRSLSECWRAELRPHNIRVCTVCPSEVPTAFGSPDGVERPEEDAKLRSYEIAHSVKAILEMDRRGFIPELSVFATNPWKS